MEREAVPGQSSRVNGALISFKALVPLYGSEFTTRLLDCFCRKSLLRAGSYSAAQARKIERFLLFVADGSLAGVGYSAPRARTFEALANGGIPTASDFEDSINEMVDRLRDKSDTTFVSTQNLSSRRSFVENTAMAIRDMAAEGLWPTVRRVRQIFKRPQMSTIPALGELEGPETTIHPIIGCDPNYSKIMSQNKVRLDALRRCLVKTFDREWKSFSLVRKIIDGSNSPPLRTLQGAADLVPRNYGLGLCGAELPKIVRSCYPLDDEERRLSNVVRLLEPRFEQGLRFGGLPWSWQQLVRSCGGAERVGAAFGGTGIGLASAYGIVLIDTGFNVQSCDDLLSEPVQIKTKHGKQQLSTISSHKLRAKGKIVQAVTLEATVPLRDREEYSCLQVIECWRKMSDSYRVSARRQGSNLDDRLWVLPKGRGLGGTVAPYEHSSFSVWWAAILAEHYRDSSIGAMKITRRHIRSTVIQIAAADAGVRGAAAALVGNHGAQATTYGYYLNRGWFKSELDELIRPFLSLFEASLLSKDGAASSRLSAGAEEMARRKRAAADSGLGFQCADPFAGVQDGIPEGTRCTKIESCATCSLVRFVPSEGAYRDLVLAERSLAAAQDRFISQNPRRWRSVWLPLLALVRATIQRLEESHRRAAFFRERDAVDFSLAQGDLTLVVPW